MRSRTRLVRRSTSMLERHSTKRPNELLRRKVA